MAVQKIAPFDFLFLFFCEWEESKLKAEGNYIKGSELLCIVINALSVSEAMRV